MSECNACNGYLSCPCCEPCEKIEKWISVKDRLPTKNKRYLVIHLDDNHAWNDDRLGFSSFFTETKEFNHTNIGWWFDIPVTPTKSMSGECDG